MTTPERIQLRRANGWRMPENTVKVDRSTKWGNPYVIGTREELASLFRRLIAGETPEAPRLVDQLNLREYRARILRNIDQLRGKNLACWCPLDQPCHADVLLELANAPGDANDAAA
jgi:hypothetical protein